MTKKERLFHDETVTRVIVFLCNGLRRTYRVGAWCAQFCALNLGLPVYLFHGIQLKISIRGGNFINSTSFISI